MSERGGAAWSDPSNEATGPALGDPEPLLEDHDGDSGLPISPVQLLQNVDVERLVGDDLLKAGVLFLELVSLFASSAFMPQYWFLQRCQVDSVISSCLATVSYTHLSG